MNGLRVKIAIKLNAERKRLVWIGKRLELTVRIYLNLYNQGNQFI
jgi:hypothetical protein